MSFGSGFGSGGGFGANKTNNTFGFGANNTGSGFGQQTTSSGFGSSTNNTSGSGFGSTPSIFGSGGSGFGSAPSFGGTTANNSSTGGGLFGNTANNNTSSGFGGFGANNNTTSNTTSGGLFGNTNRTGFGNNASTGLFGNSGNNASTNAFGSSSNNSNSLFGSAPTSTALGQPVPESQGTAAATFQAYTEKDTPTGNATNQFQTITFMQPYQKHSLEELRIGDYNQGRRFGTATGQTGGFGSSSFGGFGNNNNASNTGSSLFGQQSQAPAFGNNTSTTSNAFGGGTNNTGTGFGLFGNANNQQSGNTFGTANNATGFGNQQQSSTFGSGTGGGLFGNAQTSKPPGLSFGTGTTNNTSGGLFGNTNQGTSTGFGTQNNTGGGGLFGNLGQNNTFGTATSSASNSTPFGTATTNNTTGGLFGNLGQNNQQSTGGGLFGNNNAASGSSLFGQNKPTTNTGSNTFGNTNSTGGGGLFGNLSNNNANQNQQTQGGGLFGTSLNTGTSGGLFGTLSNNNAAQNNANQSTGLFGSLGQTQNQNANQSAGLFGNQNANNSSTFMNSSLLNNSQQANALQPPQAYIASMLDRNPYGSASIFNGLPPPPQTSPGPIATPISIGSTQKKPTPLPQYKLNSSMGSRFMTPQKRGYGFSYSTYGTPSSVSSIASTPGAYSNSLSGSSFGRNLGKSYSMSNLRRTYDGETESILSPGAFSSTNTRHSGSGGLKRLTIDRSLRTDLFGNQALAALPSPQPLAQPGSAPSLKKKVSFGSTTLNDNGSNPTLVGDDEQDSRTLGNHSENTNGQDTGSKQPAPMSQPPDPQPSGPTTRNNGRATNTRNNGHVNGIQSQNVKGNELAIVHEDETSTPTGPSRSSTRLTAPSDGRDPLPGDYYMIPTREELRKYTRSQLKQVSDFVLGRENCGFVHFDKPVDLTSLDIDHIFPNLAQMDVRSLTIYPDTPKKPHPGQGLNVPATISLPNSWPRLRDKITPSMEKSGPRFEKHVARLKQIKGTEFVRYEKESGTWVFKVPHFSTYGLDYDDLDEDDLGESQMSVLPDSPTPKSRTPKGRNTPVPPRALLQSSTFSEGLTDGSSDYDSSLEDTFEYRKSNHFPGAFDQSHLAQDDQAQMEEVRDGEVSFLEERSAVAPPHHDGGCEPSNLDGNSGMYENYEPSYEEEDSMDVVGAFPQQDTEDMFLDQSVSGARSILKATQQGTPEKPFEIAEGWAQQLQRTASPQKRDRLALRESTANRLGAFVNLPQKSPSKKQRKEDGKEITTSIDLMKSLFGQEEARRSGHGRKGSQSTHSQGLQWPYPNASGNQGSRESTKEEPHRASRKPLSFGSAGRLVCEKTNGPLRPSNRSMQRLSTRSIKEKGVQLVSIRRRAAELITQNLVYQRSCTGIYLETGFPYATAKAIPFQALERGVPDGAVHEVLIWRLASILFDDYEDDVSRDVPTFRKNNFEDRIRRDRLSEFWQGLCREQATKAVATATSAELRALAHLSMHNVQDACKVLLEGKDFRLATLVAQIGSDTTMQDDMRAQITEWGALKVLSEMTEPIRTLYDLLAGNVFKCTGQDGHVEDRALSFSISEKYNLDWKRAFGLRLWYAKPSDESIDASIRQFEEDLKDGETKAPLATISNQGDLSSGDKLKQEDVLWQMMKLFANLKESSTSARLRAILSTSSQVDSRLAFQLLRGLSRAGFYTEPADADQIVRDFAADLDNAGEWLWAAWVLLHLSTHQQRADTLGEFIYSHASDIGEEDSDTYNTLYEEFHIPEALLWSAKALYVRTVEGDYVQEVSCLIRAREFDEAHTRLMHVVGPQAIIAQEHSMLQALLDNFPNKDSVKDWKLGGQVYEDYIRLGKGLSKEEREAVIKRLMASLAIVEKQRGDKMGFEEMVALQEMSKAVGRAVLKEQNKTSLGPKFLQFSATETSHSNHRRELSLQYYRAIMAGGK